MMTLLIAEQQELNHKLLKYQFLHTAILPLSEEFYQMAEQIMDLIVEQVRLHLREENIKVRLLWKITT
ncbi:MAG: hypothetical protein ACLVKO_08165 [Dysgonomonas sp.]